ncbi:hypothetical protein PMAYCL1PPCAC_01853, partial [Pristionchus mayeri]
EFLNKRKFENELKMHFRKSIIKKVECFEVPVKFREFIDTHYYYFVQSALIARRAQTGQDYVLYADRKSRELALKIRVRRQMRDDFGMIQFLEMRHGLAITPYRIVKNVSNHNSIGDSIHYFAWKYGHVLEIQRSNPYRDTAKDDSIWNVQVLHQSISKVSHFTTSVQEFSRFIENSAQIFSNSPFIVVCPTKKLLTDAFNFFKSMSSGTVCICETALGIPRVKDENSTEMIICTTSVCFEGWTFLPQEIRNIVRILVFHENTDNYALAVAGDLVDPSQISDVILDSESTEGFKDMDGSPESGSQIETQKKSKKRIEDHGEGSQSNPLQRKRELHNKLRNISMCAKIVCSQMSSEKLDSIDSPLDISCYGFLENSRMRIEDINMKLRSQEKEIIGEKRKPIHTDLLEISKKYIINVKKLESFVKKIDRKAIHWHELRDKMKKRFIIYQDAEYHWNYSFEGRTPQSNVRLVALNSECVSKAATLLHNLKLVETREAYRQSHLQCSDRNLESCSLYYPQPGLDENILLQLDGSSIEHFTPSIDELRAIVQSRSLDIATRESWNRKCPLFLFPRRSYDRLTRDLFDKGIIICKNYDDVHRNMHSYDTIQLPVIPETSPRSVLERRLKLESALMEFGANEWMDWYARRLINADYHNEVIRFYHRSLAERDYRVEDEKLIQRLRAAFSSEVLVKATSRVEQMNLDSFVYATISSMQRGERLVVIDPPPFKCNEALVQLTHFIRSMRMPPPEF